MIYDIRLHLTHEYEVPADIRRQVFRITPADIPGRQRVFESQVLVMPAPVSRQEGRDFFGTAVTTISYATGHDRMEVRMQARVEVIAPAASLDISVDRAQLASELEGLTDLAPTSPLHYLGASPRLPLQSEIAAHARDAAAESKAVTEAVLAYGRAIHRDIAFDGTATQVDTPAIAAFQARRGVCQDMSHIMITGLRALGIPARYVSGFLRTEPPEGQPRLEGADAMHAWVAAWAGHERGWIEYDPTNDCPAGEDHIVVGYGRDYADVGPVKGVLRTSGGQSVAQAVDVIPRRRRAPARSPGGKPA